MKIPESLIGIPYDVKAEPLENINQQIESAKRLANCQRLFQLSALTLRGIALPKEACYSFEGSVKPDYQYPQLNEQTFSTLEVGDPVYWVNLHLKYPNGYPSFKYKLHITPSLGGLSFLHTTLATGSRIATLPEMINEGYAYYCANSLSSLIHKNIGK